MRFKMSALRDLLVCPKTHTDLETKGFYVRPLLELEGLEGALVDDIYVDEKVQVTCINCQHSNSLRAFLPKQSATAVVTVELEVELAAVLDDQDAQRQIDSMALVEDTDDYSVLDVTVTSVDMGERGRA